jgi:hypothetical protein
MPEDVIADYKSMIGWATWDACMSCKHYPPERGGCHAAEEDEQGWQDKIGIQDDFVYCGSYEERT